jgi:hypothetical protein
MWSLVLAPCSLVGIGLIEIYFYPEDGVISSSHLHIDICGLFIVGA